VKTVVLTLSCAAHRGAHQDVVRNTWRHDLMGITSWDQKFVLGGGNYNEADDEWLVDAPDNYAGLIVKQRMAYRRAIKESYDRVFLSCIDTYVVPFRIYRSGEWKTHAYLGRRCDGEPHAGGGNGYWLGWGALYKLAYMATPYAGGYSDQSDATDLFSAGYVLTHDNRYGVSYTKHLSKDTGAYDPQWMADLHKQFMEQRLPNE